MSVSTQPSPRAPSSRARAEAAAWLAKLHGTRRTAQMESGWRRWIAEHPDHASAWELATESWGDSSDLSAVLPTRRVPRGLTWFDKTPLRTMAAAAVVFAIAIGAFHYIYKPALTTGVGEQRTLNLIDGSRVELNTNSRVIVQFDDHTRKVSLESGEAYFAVAHERRPFIVLAGDRKIVALGTSFVVSRDAEGDGALSVTLIEGRVAVAPAAAIDVLAPEHTREVTLLDAGKRWTAARHVPPTIDSPSIEKETAWRRGQLVFDNTRLIEAATEFNRYNAVQIKIDSEDIGNIPVGGIFRTGDAITFATIVADAHHLHLTQNDREIHLVMSPSDQ
jgi:transmembrane sensor